MPSASGSYVRLTGKQAGRQTKYTDGFKVPYRLNYSDFYYI